MYANDPEQALVPIFAEEKYSNRLHQVGTAIFVDFQSQPFLFTAAHVTDNLQQGKLLVPTRKGIEEIEGYVAHIDLPPEIPRKEDEIDIAYYRLSTEFARSMVDYFKPLPQSRCELIESALSLGVCSVYGYPASKAKLRNGKYSSESATYRGVASDETVYRNLNLFPDSSIIIHFHKKRTVSPDSGERINLISPRGVSGGGIFSWPKGHELSNDWSLPKLVGIFHTYEESEGLMIGTHLISLISAIQLGEMKGYGGII